MTGARTALCSVILLGAALALPTAAFAQAAEPAVRVSGSPALRPIVDALAAAFARTPGGGPVTADLRGASAAVDALTAQVADVGIVDRAAWEAERRPFRQIVGSEPVAFRIAVLRVAAMGRVSPALYVNRGNPLRGLASDRVARILTSGAGAGDVTRWDQLGLSGAYGEHRIHLYGLRDDGGFATNLRLDLLAGRQYAPSYEALGTPQAVVAAIRADPFGIAALDMLPAAAVRGIARLAIQPTAGSARDPLTPYVIFYVARPTRDRPNRAGIALVRFALSPAGQRALAAHGDQLGNTEIAAERNALEEMANEAR